MCILRRRGAETPVAFIGNNDQRSRFGHQEVGPADAQVSLQELVPQGNAGYPGHFLDVIGEGDAQFLMEEFRNLFLGLVEGRGHQVRGSFFRQLDDVLAQVRFVNLNAVGFQGLVEVQFLGNHGLALGSDLDVSSSGNLRNYLIGLGRVPREVNVSARLGHAVVEQFQVIVQVVQGMNLDAPGLFPPGFPNVFANLADGVQPGLAEPPAHLGERPPQDRVLDGRARKRSETGPS